MRNKVRLDEQGIETLRLFSRNLEAAADRYRTAGNELIDDLDRAEGGLGQDACQVEKLIEDLNTILQQEMVFLEELGEYCSYLAARMETLISACNELGGRAGTDSGPMPRGSASSLPAAEQLTSQTLTGEKSDTKSYHMESHASAPSGTDRTGVSMELNRSTPRKLAATRYGMEEDSQGNLVYDSPLDLDHCLYTRQGSADSNFRGTCGLCCCANILRMSGINIGELEMIRYASQTYASGGFAEKLCTTGNADGAENGGTSARDRKEILEHFGIPSSIIGIELNQDGSVARSNMERIASWVETGKGVILPLHASVLWKDSGMSLEEDWHAVTVTSVRRNRNGEVLGFFLCDSADEGTHYYDAGQVYRAMFGAACNVTQTIIR